MVTLRRKISFVNLEGLRQFRGFDPSRRGREVPEITRIVSPHRRLDHIAREKGWLSPRAGRSLRYILDKSVAPDDVAVSTPRMSGFSPRSTRSGTSAKGVKNRSWATTPDAAISPQANAARGSAVSGRWRVGKS